MKAKPPKGDMPFLDHLEELRWRILWSLLALTIGVVVGFFVVQRFDVLGLLRVPIAPYLPDGRLFVTRPTDAFMITLKLAVGVGLVLASPVIVAQVWLFLSPALFPHERRYLMPALIAGASLFLVGVVMAYRWVLPAALRFLLMFQREDLETIITANEYLAFAIQLIVAFGLVFELPLVMVLLAGLGLVSPATFARQRPIALVLACVVAALVTPPDVASMVLMLVPMWVLYEAGIAVGRVAYRRRAQRTIGTAALVLLAVAAAPEQAAAQQPTPPPTDTARVRVDSLSQPMDTAAARRLGLPTAPSRSLPPADSVLQALLRRAGYTVTRYAGDSVTLFGETNEIQLVGSALIERDGTTLEADTVSFRQAACRLRANGSPALFESGTVLVGEGMRYDTCERRGTVASALTSFQQSGVTWYLRGGLEIDSASTRVYGASNDMTSCDLPTPHYHFAAGNVKWVTNTIMVARPAVLYVRDVPILWLPFIFQDMRTGRRTGLLVPRFGLSDLVRPNEGYRRHVSNLGYYVVLNDYLDVQASLDWFAGNYIGVNGQIRYRWLDRFLSGNLAMSRLFEEGLAGEPGGRSLRLQWNHEQSFSQRTRLTASVDFATSARVVQRNAVDPFLQTATLGSRLNFNKQFDWGTVSLGGSRTQDLSNGTVSQTLPTLSLTPRAINLSRDVTWSPTMSLTNTQTFDQGPPILIARPPLDGVARDDSLFPDTRTTSLSVGTPLRVGQWNWTNSFTVVDFRTTRPQTQPFTFPDPNNPADSVNRYLGEDFRTEVNWETGINLPTLFSSSWKLQPSVGIRNTTSGPFLLRNAFTQGGFVSQGKRLAFGASLSPTLFGFFPGFGPIARIRHAVSPRITWSYAPAADVPDAYARALNPTNPDAVRTSPALHQVSFGLSQIFEAKLESPPGDTATDPRQAPKRKLLSIQTSSITYDFEQAKLEGRNGWRTQSLQNTLTSELLPGFSVATTHDLWNGPVGLDTSPFDPFLQSVSARFTLSARTFASILGLLTGRAPPEEGPEERPGPQDLLQPSGTGLGPPTSLDAILDRQATAPRGRGLSAAFTYDDRRTRPQPDAPASRAFGTNRTLGMQVGFSPTDNWGVSYNTQYNFTTDEFTQHVLRLDRDLHRWRATFSFIKSPNGNFAFNFFISLLDQPDIKFTYDQRTVRRER